MKHTLLVQVSVLALILTLSGCANSHSPGGDVGVDAPGQPCWVNPDYRQGNGIEPCLGDEHCLFVPAPCDLEHRSTTDDQEGVWGACYLHCSYSRAATLSCSPGLICHNLTNFHFPAGPPNCELSPPDQSHEWYCLDPDRIPPSARTDDWCRQWVCEDD